VGRPRCGLVCLRSGRPARGPRSLNGAVRTEGHDPRRGRDR
jgi:hypothetical protein